MYEVLRFWEDPPDLAQEPPQIRDFAEIWQASDKIVYSSSLESVSTARTRIEREFDPEAVRRTKEAADSDVSVGGPGLAGAALRSGIVDECHVFLNPVVVGSGTAWLPRGVRIDLELLGERRFAGGIVHLRYRIASGR
jgi:dihydrofolate reductase